MKIISQQECEEWVAAHLGRDFARDAVAADYASRVVYQLPTDTGKKTAIARAVSRSIDTRGLGLFWITAWGIFPSSENMAIFDGYRKFLGEERAIHAAPGHVFGASDLPQLECLFDLTLYFYWDASLFEGAGNIVVTASHDECVSVHAKDAAYLRQFQNTLDGLKLKEVRGP